MSNTLSSVMATIPQDGPPNEAARLALIQQVKTALQQHYTNQKSVILLGIHLSSQRLEILNQAIAELNPRDEAFNAFVQDCTFDPVLPPSALRFLSNNVYLGLTGCGITDQQIAQYMTQNPYTMGIDLSHNALTAGGVETLLRSQQSMGGVGGIDLAFNQIDGRIVPILIEKIRNGTLKETYIDLSGNLLTEDDKTALKQAALNSQTRIILETDHKEQLLIDQQIAAEGRTRFERSPTFAAGAMPAGATRKLLNEWITLTAQQLATIQDEDEYNRVLRRSVLNMRRLFEKDQGFSYLEAPSLRLNDHSMRVLVALLKPDYNTSLTGINLKWNAHTPELFETFLTILQGNSRLESLDLNFSQLTDEDLRKLFEVLKTNTTLKHLKLWNALGGNPATALRIAEFISANTTLQELDLHGAHFDEAGQAAILEAVRTNFTLVQRGSELPPIAAYTQYFERNRRLAELEPLARMKAIHVEHMKEKPGQPVPAHKNPIPKLKDIMQYWADHQYAEQLHQARELDNNTPIKKQLTSIKEFLSSEFSRLHGKVKNLKGRDDKSALYNALVYEVNDCLRLKSNEIAPERVFDLLRKTAIIAHHRRYSKWNTFASLFKAKYKTSNSWKLFIQKFAQNPEAQPIINTFPKSFGSRAPLKVKIKGTDQNITSYNQYRKLAMPRPTW